MLQSLNQVPLTNIKHQTAITMDSPSCNAILSQVLEDSDKAIGHMMEVLRDWRERVRTQRRALDVSRTVSAAQNPITINPIVTPASHPRGSNHVIAYPHDVELTPRTFPSPKPGNVVTQQPLQPMPLISESRKHTHQEPHGAPSWAHKIFSSQLPADNVTQELPRPVPSISNSRKRNRHGDQAPASRGKSPAGLSFSANDIELFQRQLQTRFEEVFKVDEENNFFTAPEYMYGVPVNVLSEQDPYWSASWMTLQQFLAEEADAVKKLSLLRNEIRQLEATLPHALSQQHQLDETNRLKTLQADIKPVAETVRQYQIVRDQFRITLSRDVTVANLHPNQLLGKQHLPAEGMLCKAQSLAKLLPRLKDLIVLKHYNEIRMEPLEFLRWRLGTIIQQRATQRRRNRSCLVAVAANLSLQNTPYYDPLTGFIHHRAQDLARSGRLDPKCIRLG